MELGRPACSGFLASCRAALARNSGYQGMRRVISRSSALTRLLAICFVLPSCLSHLTLAYGVVTYSVTDMGTFRVLDVNNEGQAVGSCYVAGSGWHTILYKDRAATDLGILTGSFTLVRSINGNGEITGWGDAVGDGHEHAFIYSNEAVTPINISGANYSYAYDINDAGQTVGKADFAGGQTLGFRYQNGIVSPLPTLGGQWSVASAINNKGQIAGYSLDASNNSHVFLWENGNMTDLGSMDGASCYPEAINDNSQIVGYTYSAGSTSGNGFLYDHGTVVQLNPLTAADKFCQAASINDVGQVVGDSFAFLTSPGRPFLYESGTMTDLNDLISPDSGWVLRSARSINDQGQIVGNGLFNGVDHAYLLTPIPEPATLTLATIAGVMLLVFRTRRVVAEDTRAEKTR